MWRAYIWDDDDYLYKPIQWNQKRKRKGIWWRSITLENQEQIFLLCFVKNMDKPTKEEFSDTVKNMDPMVTDEEVEDMYNKIFTLHNNDDSKI